MQKKADKPFYVPNKDELLKYTDQWYFEKTKQYWDLYEYIKKNIYEGDDTKTQTILKDIWVSSHNKFNVDVIMNKFNKRKIKFDGIDQVNEVLDLVMEFSNSIRIWKNNGYPPNEMFVKYEKPYLKSLPDKTFEFEAIAKIDRNDPLSDKTFDFEAIIKISRNDPCPCGSGKKYKKCCRKNR